MVIKCVVFVSQSTITQIACIVLSLSQWTLNPWTMNPTSTQGCPAAAEVIMVVDVQYSPTDRLGTLPRSQLLLVSCYSTRMSVSGLCTVYFPYGALSMEYCDPHLGFFF